jgi:hypothetical protein
MHITQYPRHIFWQYSPEADLPELVVLEKMLLYGDLDDLLALPQHFSPYHIKQVLKTIEAGGRWKKRVFFIYKIVLAE